jgi:hypothetical protein
MVEVILPRIGPDDTDPSVIVREQPETFAS